MSKLEYATVKSSSTNSCVDFYHKVNKMFFSMKVMLENKHMKNLPAKSSNIIKHQNKCHQAVVLLIGSLVLQHRTTVITISVLNNTKEVKQIKIPKQGNKQATKKTL